MISRTTAIRITTKNFPKGPEALAKHLGVVVRAAALEGVEGWCVLGPTTVIRVNSKSTLSRQRFTLAHELAHLVLGTEPDIASEPFRSNRKEERDADQLASEFLIPNEQLHAYLSDKLPVDAKTLGRLAKAANVSPVMAACRVVNATDELDLQNAAVVFFVDGREQWRYSHGLEFDERDAQRLFRLAMKHKPQLVREDNQDGNVAVGSIIDAQAYQVLLIQLLPEDQASKETVEEQVSRLAKKVFGDDLSFRQSVAAVLGSIKTKCSGQNLDDVCQFFFRQYVGPKYTGTNASALRSQSGREYVRLHLQRWFL